MQIYDVSEARKTIFLERIHIFFKKYSSPDSITDKDELARWFLTLKQKYADASLFTMASVILRFARWLFEGSLPPSYLAICPYTKKKSRRSLRPEQMVTWEEGLALAQVATSIQVQGITLTQLDGGFRPSEFIQLTYQDAQFVNGLLAARVPEPTKTGERFVVLYRSTAYLKVVLDNHPSKRPNDPLWYDEHHYRVTGEVIPAKYATIAKQVKALGKKIGLDKPLDFYNLRHSSCVLDKKDNVPADLAAERHGHSIGHYMDVYGRLDVCDTVNRFKSHFGADIGTSQNQFSQYAPNPSVMKPPATHAESQAQQFALQQQILQMQERLHAMQSYAPGVQNNIPQQPPSNSWGGSFTHY